MLIVGTETKMRKSCHKTRLQDMWFVYVPAVIAERFSPGGRDMIAACVHPESPDFRIRVEFRFPQENYWPRDSARLWIAEGSRRGTLRVPPLLPFEAANLPDTVAGLLSVHADDHEYLVWECLNREAAGEVNG